MKIFLLVLSYLAVSHAWTCTEAPRLYRAAQVDAGQGKVVARNWNHYVYFLSGSIWYRLGSVRLKHVSVGPAGLWGADTKNRVYKYIGGNFRLAAGVSLQQVDAGSNAGQVVGVAPSTLGTYCLRSTSALAYSGVGSLRWTSLSRRLKYYSCGPLRSSWGVDTSSQVYFTQRLSPATCAAARWMQVPGLALKMVEIGTDGNVFGVTTAGLVYQRSGISRRRPQGTAWVPISMCMPVSHLSYDLGQLWIVTTSGLILQCSH